MLMFHEKFGLPLSYLGIQPLMKSGFIFYRIEGVAEHLCVCVDILCNTVIKATIIILSECNEQLILLEVKC